MSDSDVACDSPNALKRKPDDDEKALEAEIKRVALDDVLPGAARISDYIHMRMLCLVKDASMVVGHKGERISRIKLETGTRINVSENIKNVPERVVFLRGSCENVAKAFGKISRAINDEDDRESNDRSLPLTVNLLVPHHLMGYVIGKQGSRLREIEDLSAARLVAGPQQLPLSNDRVLCITGVADAIHIATYYVGQTILSCEPKYRARKTIFYQPSAMHSVLVNNYGIAIQHQQHHQYHPGDKAKRSRSRMSPALPPTPNEVVFHSYLPLGAPVPGSLAVANNLALPHVRIVEGINPQTRITSVVQEIFIEELMVGNVIGRGGKNITQIKESTGCSIQIADPVPGKDERKLTIIGTPIGNQTAVMMINNKIDIDKRNQHNRHSQQHNGHMKT
ncbi:AFL018Cp [Eremothecium gossypii ATCC 10895]|uniref:AFL018Cp n=1 Tax=Eremothecium gossypii (strain ATCC 10895 / CBS 109.51 / FGSC 9923 / NRRL Y-1056) TaxID=284811 RepID=Q754T9_EREGS|nr:AFL018Cp [Eremothecium gossypii ATCC 10895]AAS53354.1 AFL018Cp [Eremothecium gossypii ATCC 10895]AEY97665.1 FAFL018Cp [Eremothecium gossypii FDAG1]